MSRQDFPEPILYSAKHHVHLIPAIAKIHRDCVHHDGLIASIIDVDHPTKLTDYWAERSKEAEAGAREIVLQFADSDQKELAGVVSLLTPESETGPFRSFVEKLMVSPDHRRKGFARALMEKLEAVAVGKGRGLIVLGTNIGYPAEKMYPKLGYKTFGLLPKNGICPKTGEWKDELYLYKDLRTVDKVSQ